MEAINFYTGYIYIGKNMNKYSVKTLEETLSGYIQIKINKVSKKQIDEVRKFVKEYGCFKYTKKEIKDYLKDKNLIKESSDSQAQFMIKKTYSIKEIYNTPEEEIKFRIKREILHYSGKKYIEEIENNFIDWMETDYVTNRELIFVHKTPPKKEMHLLNLLALY